MATTASQKPVKSSSAATGEKPSFLLFGGLALIGLLKDTLDLIGIGSLPVLGTGITLCFSFFSFMLLLLFDRSGGRGNKRLAQGMVVTFGTLVEGIGFVINFLPLQTLTVVFLYLISYKSWKSSQQAASAVQGRQRSKLQTQQARMARAVALREERMRQQTTVAAMPAQAVQPANVSRSVSRPSTPMVSNQAEISPQSRPDVASASALSLRPRADQPSSPPSVSGRSALPSGKPAPLPSSARLLTSDARREIAGLRGGAATPYRKSFTKLDSRPADASVRIQDAARRLSQTDSSRRG